jgi:hypothetical protein
MPLLIAFLNLTSSMPTPASGTFYIAIAGTSAYDVFIPSLSVMVTADNLGRQGSTIFLFSCTGPPSL